MTPRTKAEQKILAGTPVSAVVYIWYPCHKFVAGHAAIYIGGVPRCPWPIGVTEPPTPPNSTPASPIPPTERRRSASSIFSRHERSPSRGSIFSRGAGSPAPYNVTERDWPSTSIQHPPSPTDNNYVSFYSDPNRYRGGLSFAGTFDNIQKDFILQPHLEYLLINLDVEKMQAKKNEIYIGKTYGNYHVSHSYSTFSKNCATIVARILTAGGVESLLNPIQRIGYGKNIYWTPKDIAQLCNELRNNDLAVKIRGLDCPDKSEIPIRTMMGFR
ncbi:hypothetical protein [Xenorhabdus budapestensis]|uniref:DUF4105 domain-containing protein n=1 Tax=Xenorhabdus budapestensis TaxID=290110 RepID=A0A2D0J5E6_XENBU|nr:hypothetical protein [Xenorhabdus budapestensis]PHM29578.1 hypothetical protein Xbud_00106 [Xenorhabdus budapestensis]